MSEEPGIVVEALSVEYRRVETRLNGATKRHAFAEAQVENESALIKQSIADLLALEDAIILAGGVAPKRAEGEEPYTND